MTDAFFPTRTVRALAVAGAFGLALSPLTAATSFAAPGTIKVVQPGVTEEDTRGNFPQIEGCAFDVRIEGADPGTYAITFAPQAPTDDLPLVQGAPQITVDDQDFVTSNYLLFEEGTEFPEQDFHIKVTVTDAADEGNVSSKVFWVRDCDPEPRNGTPETPAPETPAPEKPAPHASDSAKPSAEASVPGMVNSGIDGGNDGLVALGLGGAAVVGLGALGLRRRTRG